MKKIIKIGPAALVTAAFIGPGTVTVCTLAGVQFGYNLIWVLLLSVFACIVLQEMAARLGLVTQQGLSEVITSLIKNKIAKSLIVGLIISAILVGNAAYEAGNISGGMMGIATILESLGIYFPSYGYSVFIGLIAFIILYIGNYRVLEKILVTLVICMSLAFVITAIVVKPDVSALFNGMIPRFSSEQLFIVLGLLGTTVVPYNLFLHANLVKEKWTSIADIKEVRKDTLVAIILGGVISMAIVIVGASFPNSDIKSAGDLAIGLEPLFGKTSKFIISIGLFAAGITSAITAPLAAAYVVKGCLGKSYGVQSISFRLTWIVVLLLGVLFSSLGIKSITIIQFAQVANGILLPLVAGFLLWAMNQSVVLGQYTNSKLQNSVGILILIIAFLLGGNGILKVINSF